jgi:D,D-heptose 1,7-bisphosphate phosphatase
MKSKAVFLDRDGTICFDVPYCSCPEDFRLIPFSAEGIVKLNKNGFKVILITNQSGIARGYFTESMLLCIHEKMKDDLKKHGAYLDAIYYCPHHPDDNCTCRKPNPEMINKAVKDFDIDLSHSYMVGDAKSDIEIGQATACHTVLIKNTSGKLIDCSPDIILDNLLQAANWIIDNDKRENA